MIAPVDASNPVQALHVFQSRDRLGRRRWYFHGRGGNHEVIFQSEAYRNRQDALQLCRRMAASFRVEVPVAVDGD